MISADILKEYDASRGRRTDKSVLCHAPFVSLNFDQSGNVTACCFNREFVLGTYPEQSVREIWAGEPAQELRQAFLTGAVVTGCDRCFDQLKNRNFSGALMRNFDVYAQGSGPRTKSHHELPVALEFEISNTCTLECVMCGGHWSSTIRAKREKLPPIRNPYDARFIDQIRELIPTIVAARFLGGEPFLITPYYEIWDSIRKLNPDCEISITTSGAVIPDRPRQILEQLRANIIVSLDGITKPTYESVRKNADFDTVMTNIAYLREYTRRRGTQLTVAVCPMTHNWHEVSAIVDFCEARRINVFFNTVTFPVVSSLAGLPAARLAEVIEMLEHQGQAARWSSRSQEQWKGLTSQLRGWLDDKQSFLAIAANEAQRGQLMLGGAARAAAVATPVKAGGFFGWMRRRDAGPRVPEPVVVHPVAGGVEAWLMPVAIARCVEREKSGQPETTELLCRLPPMPLGLWPADPALPLIADLVVAVNTLRHVPAPGGNDVGPDAAATAARENTVLVELLRRSSEDPTLQPRLESLRSWMRARLEAGEVSVVEKTVARLAFDGDVAAVLLGQDGRIRQGLSDSLATLVERGVDTGLLERVSQYFNRLLSSHLPVTTSDGDSQSDRERKGQIVDEQDMVAALLSLELFDDVVGAAPDHGRLTARLAQVREAIESGHGKTVLRGMQQGDVVQAFGFMANASDGEFAGVLQTLRQ
jgi:MoaA/NifB/PqqE/SkfB family radical SAM enzyme